MNKLVEATADLLVLELARHHNAYKTRTSRNGIKLVGKFIVGWNNRYGEPITFQVDEELWPYCEAKEVDYDTNFVTEREMLSRLCRQVTESPTEKVKLNSIMIKKVQGG